MNVVAPPTVGTYFPRFALGTVQFGYAYGLARSRVQREDVTTTLARAWECGIDMLDTAPAYGDSEAIIGEARPSNTNFRIISKTVALRLPEIAPTDVERVIARARVSIEQLGVSQLDAILVHESEDLLARGSERLMSGLRRLCDEGLVRRVGVSVYDPDVLDTILERHQVDVVQMPLNVFDQRFLRLGYLDRLAQRGIEVHTRSVFLQGLLLQSPEAVPAQFAGAAATLGRFRAYAESLAISPIAATILFAGSQAGVSRLVVGIDGVASLLADVEAMSQAAAFGRHTDFSAFAIDDPAITDPRRWKL